MQKSLLVFGGNGFVGSHICKYAVQQGIKVYSVSRSGKPKQPERVLREVEYLKGNALDQSSYSEIIPQVDAVVHSIGVLIDSRTPLNIINKYEGSYEQMNRDTALRICELIHGQNKTFVYMSAERGMFFSPRYLSTKREVETYLSQNQNQIPSCVVRPGFVASKEQTDKRVLGVLIDTLWKQDALYQKLGLSKFSETFVPSRSLDVNVIAKAAVLGAFNPDFRGRTLDVNDIERAAQEYQSVF